MSESGENRVQQIFLAALNMPKEQREAWLVDACGDDKKLLNDVQSLLEHDAPENDILEKGLNGAMPDLPHTEIFTESNAHPVDEHKTIVGCDLFLEKLSEVGVLSPDEFDSMSESASSHDRANDPRQLASQLVSEGKLTEYQASALLKGKPDLLIDKYLILDLIDVGGMGMVFKAIHRTMNRVVAVKMISQQLLSSPEQVKRFQREVRVAATLEHPNIVRSYDADQTGGVHFLVMEYVRGQNLNQIARTSGPLPLPQAVDCIRQSAVGLQHAHENGIVHRDIKPGNLLLDDRGTVKVLDLGLAHVDESFQGGTQESEAEDADSGRPYLSLMEPTAAGTILGTASFMAPEQSLDAHLVDFRSDVYSLGCTFYFLLTGDTPYSGSTVFKVFVQHREGEIPSLQEKRPDVPDSIESIYRQMVAKKPEDRFQSMGDLIVALDECQIALPATRNPVRRKADATASTEDLATIMEPEPAETSTAKASQRKPSAIWASFAVVAALVVAALSWPDGRIGTDELVIDQDDVNDSGAPGDEITPTSTSDVDASSLDESTASAADLLATGEWEWKLEKNLGPPINSPELEFAADMTADGLTCVVASRSGRGGSVRDLFIATRPSTAASWSNPVRLPAEINTSDEETDPLLSADGLTLSFLRVVRQGKNAGPTRLTTRRKSADSTWSIPVQDSNEKALGRLYKLTRDRLTAFTVKPRNPSEVGSAHVLQTWRRSTPFESFERSTTSNLGDSGPPMKDGGTLSSDGRFFIFAQQVSAPEATRQLAFFIVTRANWDAPWSRPVRLNLDPEFASLNAPRLQLNDKSLLFASDLAEDGHGRHDIWMARLVKKEPVAESESAADLIATGDWEWKVDEKLPAPINSLDTEFGADITADGLTIVVSSANGLRKEDRDLLIATRVAPAEPWSNLTRLPAIVNTDRPELSPEFSDNGLTLGFIRRGAEGPTWLTTRRDNVEADWTLPVESERGNGLGLRHGLTRDRLTAFKLQKPTPSSDDPRYRVLTSRRSALSEPFGESDASFLGDSGLQMGSGTLSNDGRLLIYIQGGLWMVTRDDWQSPWSKPVSLLSEFSGFQAPRLLSDDRSLLFTSGLPNGGGGSQDIYMARLVRKQAATTTPSAADLIATGDWEWRVEKNLGPIVNSTAMDAGADMTADGLTMVLCSLRKANPPDNRDLWIATRSSRTGPWSAPMRLPDEINTDEFEERPRISSDGLSLWFRRSGNERMYSTRDSLTDTWSEAIADPYADGDRQDYELTPNELTAFRPYVALPDNSQARIDGTLKIWRRISLTSPFQEMQEQVLPSVSRISRSGTLSDDGRMYIFKQRVEGDQKLSPGKLFLSIRPDWNTTWSQPAPLFSEQAVMEGSPRLLPDNRTMLFTANREGGQGSGDICLARLVEKESVAESESAQ